MPATGEDMKAYTACSPALDAPHAQRHPRPIRAHPVTDPSKPGPSLPIRGLCVASQGAPVGGNTAAPGKGVCCSEPLRSTALGSQHRTQACIVWGLSPPMPQSIPCCVAHDRFRRPLLTPRTRYRWRISAVLQSRSFDQPPASSACCRRLEICSGVVQCWHRPITSCDSQRSGSPPSLAAFPST